LDRINDFAMASFVSCGCVRIWSWTLAPTGLLTRSHTCSLTWL